MFGLKVVTFEITLELFIHVAAIAQSQLRPQFQILKFELEIMTLTSKPKVHNAEYFRKKHPRIMNYFWMFLKELLPGGHGTLQNGTELFLS